jgi:hypothetical protein
VIQTKHRRAVHSGGSKLQNCEKAARNTKNIVQLALVGVNLPAIYAGNPPGVHAVDSDKKLLRIPNG